MGSSSQNRFRRGLLVALWLGSSIAQAQPVYYPVNPGDQLIKILKRLQLQPIYGPEGSLEQCLKLNSALRPQMGDQIFPGEKIYFSDSQKSQIQKIASVDGDGRILFQKPRLAAAEVVAEKVPAVVVTPSTEIKKQIETASPESSELTLSLGSEFRRLTAEDTSNGSRGQMGSGADPLANFLWRLRLAPEAFLDFAAGYESVSISEPASKNFRSVHQDLVHLYAGGGYQLSDRAVLRVGFGAYQNLFYRALSDSDLQIDRVAMSEAQAGLRYKFFSKKSVAVTGGLDLLYGFPFDTDFYKASATTGYRVELEAEQRRSGYAILATTFYVDHQTKVSPVNFHLQEMGLTLGIKWFFNSEGGAD